MSVRAGDIVNVRDPNGVAITTYIMKMSLTPSGTSIESTGNKSYDGNAAVSSTRHSNLTGKILELKMSFEGLVIRNEDLAGKVSGLELTTEQFRTYVEETFVSEGEFSKYKSEVEQTAKAVETRFESVEESISETHAHVKTGLLDYKDDGTPVYGMEIGQRTEVNDVETFDKYARFTAEKLSFYDSNSNEVSYISDKKQYVTHTEVTGSSKLGGFVDIALEDRSVVTKWVGGE
jgi:predicted RNase H-like nuclease (RuvC/YqgF family)